jgi:catechol 2,3-dioxygenase-like lactoylglutathione lyase family enzyme
VTVYINLRADGAAAGGALYDPGVLSAVEEHRPGPKPKRLFLRAVHFPSSAAPDLPARRGVGTYLAGLERVGRLVAQGALAHPVGDLLVFRATDRPEATRILRTDPWRERAGSVYVLLEWDPRRLAEGVNLEPAPARGSGRLTVLDRVAVVVRDQARARAWYEQVLGLRIRRSDPSTGYLELSLGPGAAALSLVAPRPEWGAPHYAETLARAGQPTGIVFRTDSVPALELRLRHAGATITQPPRAEPWGGVTLRFDDPDGNEFLAYQAGAAAAPIDRAFSARERAPTRAGAGRRPNRARRPRSA